MISYQRFFSPTDKEFGIDMNGRCKRPFKESYKIFFQAFDYNFQMKLFAFALGILARMHRSVSQIFQRPSENLLLWNGSGEGPVNKWQCLG